MEKMQYYGTLGPACESAAVLERMFCAGMTGARLNLSHGDPGQSKGMASRFRDAAKRCGAGPARRSSRSGA